jgi:hypothetical protein
MFRVQAAGCRNPKPGAPAAGGATASRLRRYKTMPLPELTDRSTNETLARTVMTSLTTLLAPAALVVAGGPVLHDFTIAMIWGLLVGTYCTVYVASPVVLDLDLRRESTAQAAELPADDAGNQRVAAMDSGWSRSWSIAWPAILARGTSTR